MEKLKYCSKCGNTGLINGKPCSCKMDRIQYAGLYKKMNVPVQYQSIEFESMFLPEINSTYKSEMQDLYEQLLDSSSTVTNVLICSPPQSGKHVLAYAVMQRLYVSGGVVFPIKDGLELRQIIQALDYGKEENIEVFQCPVLFVSIPPMLIPSVFETLTILMSRRTLLNLTTVFLFNGTYKQLEDADRLKVYTGYNSDGSLLSYRRIGL